MAHFSFFKRLCEIAFYINVIFFTSSHSYLELDIGLTYDDYLVREVVNFTSNGGWNNGDYLIDNSSRGIIYHGPFDEYTLGITSTLSRQLRVANYGYIRVNFTLIFGCDILNFTDNINLHFDRNAQAAEYYWIDTYSYDYSTNNYPYTTSDGFIIEEYYDSVLLDSSYCTNNINGIGNTISWAIHDSYLSPITYKPGDTFLFALTGRFNHDIPYNNDGKYWAVTNIVFELIHIQTEYPTFDPTEIPTYNPTQQPTINPITSIPTTISPTNNPITIVPTTVPTNNPTTTTMLPTMNDIITTENDGKMNENGNKRKPNYSVLIILIVIFVIMVIVIIVMTIKKKKKLRLINGSNKMSMENNIEMGDKQSVDDGGLLTNDAMKENKETEKENDELISDHNDDETVP